MHDRYSTWENQDDESSLSLSPYWHRDNVVLYNRVGAEERQTLAYMLTISTCLYR